VPPVPPVPTRQRREALARLGLQDPVERSEVVSAYRRLARQHHPDLGGDPDTFRALTVARDRLLVDAHGGAGGSTTSSGGRSVTVRRRRSRRILRRLRRRLGRKGEERRDLG
jgi:hypothetical protein